MSQLQRGHLYNELMKQGHFLWFLQADALGKKSEQSLHFAILRPSLLSTTC